MHVRDRQVANRGVGHKSASLLQLGVAAVRADNGERVQLRAHLLLLDQGPQVPHHQPLHVPAPGDAQTGQYTARVPRVLRVRTLLVHKQRDTL